MCLIWGFLGKSLDIKIVSKLKPNRPPFFFVLVHEPNSTPLSCSRSFNSIFRSSPHHGVFHKVSCVLFGEIPRQQMKSDCSFFPPLFVPSPWDLCIMSIHMPTSPLCSLLLCAFCCYFYHIFNAPKGADDMTATAVWQLSQMYPVH